MNFKVILIILFSLKLVLLKAVAKYLGDISLTIIASKNA